MKKCQHQSLLGDLSLSSPLVMHMHNDAVYNYTARSYSFFNAICQYSAPEMPLLLGPCSTGALALDCCYLNQKGDLWNHTRLVPWRRCWAVVLWILQEFKLSVKARAATLWMRVWEWGSTPAQMLSEMGFVYNAVRKNYAGNLSGVSPGVLCLGAYVCLVSSGGILSSLENSTCAL